jgi:hypothetical protein
MNSSSRFLTLVVAGGAMALAACGGSNLSPVASTAAVTGSGTGTCTDNCDATSPVGSDPVDISTVLVAALQEEYRAQMLYRSVLQTFGAETAPFASIERGEARHVEALQVLFARRQMAPPASVWNPGSFAPFVSVPLACAAGVEAERADADFYTPHLSRADLPQDVRK